MAQLRIYDIELEVPGPLNVAHTRTVSDSVSTSEQATARINGEPVHLVLTATDGFTISDTVTISVVHAPPPLKPIADLGSWESPWIPAYGRAGW